MDKILEMLGVDKLDESKQSEIKNKLSTLIETKVDEQVKEKESELKEDLTEQYEEKFNEYKQDITEKFSNFLDEVLDEEMQIPEKVVEYARKGELYESVIEQFKTKLAIDEGYIEDEVKDLLRECKSEIGNLKEQVNGLTSDNMELKKDAKELSAGLYIREKCEGLPLQQKEQIVSLLEGITSKEEIDRKFDVLVESTKKEGEDLNEDYTHSEEIVNEEVNETTNDPFDNMKSFWLNVINESK